MRFRTEEFPVHTSPLSHEFASPRASTGRRSPTRYQSLPVAVRSEHGIACPYCRAGWMRRLPPSIELISAPSINSILWSDVPAVCCFTHVKASAVEARLLLPRIAPPLVAARGVAMVAVVDDELYIVQQHGRVATRVVAGQVDADMVVALLWQGAHPQQIHGNPVVVDHSGIAGDWPHRVGPVVPLLAVARDLFAIEP